MTNSWIRFGRPDAFEIAVRWVADAEPLERRPAGHGWSMGWIKLVVAGENVTEIALQGERQLHVGWYLSPMLDWLATHWVALLHEEHFAWHERTRLPAVVACRRALDTSGAACDPIGREAYRRTHAWYHRHGLRAAALGGIFPDLFIRRSGDDIELSWTPDPPPFAPEGLTFESGAGHVRLAVVDVAEPLWELLQWVVAQPPEIPEAFRGDWENLCRKVEALERLETVEFERAYVPAAVLDSARIAFQQIDRLDLFQGRRSADCPCIEEFSPAVAMFGGVCPELGQMDIEALRDVLASGCPGGDGPELSALVRSRQGTPLDVPHMDGDRFATELLEDLDQSAGSSFVDVQDICIRLGITIDEIEFETDSIRGVALAGEGFSPKIVINLAHVYNSNEEGRRFTIGHELCHILFDRTRARRIAHVSGSWAPPGIEKRANAFAAYLLMPRTLIAGNMVYGNRLDNEQIGRLAGILRVNESPLVEHLYNINLIGDVERARLRTSIRWLQ